MRVPLLQVHKRPESALYAVDISAGIGPFVTQLNLESQYPRSACHTSTQGITYKDSTIHSNRRKSIVDMAYTLVVHAARRIFLIDLMVWEVDCIHKHHIGDTGRHT